MDNLINSSLNPCSNGICSLSGNYADLYDLYEES